MDFLILVWLLFFAFIAYAISNRETGTNTGKKRLNETDEDWMPDELGRLDNHHAHSDHQSDDFDSGDSSDGGGGDGD